MLYVPARTVCRLALYRFIKGIQFSGNKSVLQGYILRKAVPARWQILSLNQWIQISFALRCNSESVLTDKTLRHNFFDIGNIFQISCPDPVTIRRVCQTFDRRHHGIMPFQRQLNGSASQFVCLFYINGRRNMTRRTLQIIGYGPMKGMFQLVTDQIGDYWSRAAKVLMPEGIACPLVGKKTAIRLEV